MYYVKQSGKKMSSTKKLVSRAYICFWIVNSLNHSLSWGFWCLPVSLFLYLSSSSLFSLSLSTSEYLSFSSNSLALFSFSPSLYFNSLSLLLCFPYHFQFLIQRCHLIHLQNVICSIFKIFDPSSKCHLIHLLQNLRLRRIGTSERKKKVLKQQKKRSQIIHSLSIVSLNNKSGNRSIAVCSRKFLLPGNESLALKE